MQRTDSLEKTWCWKILKAGGEGDDRGWDGWMPSLTQWTWVWETLGDGEGQGSLACCSEWGCKESGMIEPVKNNLGQSLASVQMGHIITLSHTSEIFV